MNKEFNHILEKFAEALAETSEERERILNGAIDSSAKYLRKFKNPVDIDKYIEQGLLSRYKKTKSKFVIHCDLKELPEDIGCRSTGIERKKDGQLILTVNLKVIK